MLLSSRRTTDAYNLLRHILLDHDMTRRNLAGVAEQIRGANGAAGRYTARHELTDELAFAVVADVAAEGAAHVVFTIEAIGNAIDVPFDFPVTLGRTLPAAVPEADPAGLISALSCRGAEDDDIEEKIAYIDNMQTLLETLA